MKCKITLQERLKDLKVAHNLNLEELAKLTGISKSALGNYENDDYKEINHGNLVTLAQFYNVSTDYLLCLTENKNHPNTDLTNLHLNDNMIDLLLSSSINNRLLCEIATHDKFKELMADTEIFVDGVATKRFNDLNSSLETLSNKIWFSTIQSLNSFMICLYSSISILSCGFMTTVSSLLIFSFEIYMRVVSSSNLSMYLKPVVVMINMITTNRLIILFLKFIFSLNNFILQFSQFIPKQLQLKLPQLDSVILQASLLFVSNPGFLPSSNNFIHFLLLK